jgi:hypothetical protein
MKTCKVYNIFQIETQKYLKYISERNTEKDSDCTSEENTKHPKSISEGNTTGLGILVYFRRKIAKLGSYFTMYFVTEIY